MSREIKFRAWDNANNEWLNEADGEFLTIHLDGSYEINRDWVLVKPDLTIEQYTGLKDRNGKEIYEGDIVDYVGECTCVVQYEDKGARFIHRDISDDFPFGFNGLEEYNGKLFEVIGNIHENPELLEGEK